MDDEDFRARVAKVLREVNPSESGERRIQSYGTDYQRSLQRLYEEIKWLTQQTNQ